MEINKQNSSLKSNNSTSILWLFVLFIIFTALAVWFLRQNSLKTIELQQKVLTSDEQGEGVEESVRNLGDHIVSSMNSNMVSSIQLPNSFNRDYEKLVSSSEAITNAQYLRVREKCVTFDVPVEVQSECIRQETNQITDEDFSLPPELYSFNYKAPFWSPDLAGWFSLFAVVSGVVLFAKTSRHATKIMLKNHR